MKAAVLSIAAVLSAGTGAVLAQSSAPDEGRLRWAMTAASGDPSAGAAIAANGTQAGAPPCVTCHGEDGRGIAETGAPRVAGQPAYYLGKQLADYASGARENPIMTPIARALDQGQRSDAAAYYATLGGAPPARDAAPQGADLRLRGETLVLRGSNGDGIQACTNCHGSGGTGQPPAYPYLAGLDADYLRQQLELWKSGARANDPAAVMRGIAARLAGRDIEALVAYLGEPAGEAEAAR